MTPQIITLVAYAMLVAGGVQHWVDLAWDSSTDATNDHYNIYRSPTRGGPYVQIGTSYSAPNYQDADVHPGQTYYYVVTAVDATQTESAYSKEVAATIPGDGAQSTLTIYLPPGPGPALTIELPGASAPTAATGAAPRPALKVPAPQKPCSSSSRGVASKC